MLVPDCSRSPCHHCEFTAIRDAKAWKGKGSGKSAGSVGHDDETRGSGPDRRLPREPLGPYNRPFPVDGCLWERRMWASERRKGKGKGKSTSAGLLDIMIDQLPMLTEKGLREMMVALSCELSFRGDVREQNEEVQLAHEASGGKGSAFPPEELLEIVRSRGSRGEEHEEARDARGEEHEEDEYRIPPGEGDRYWNEFGEEQFYED